MIRQTYRITIDVDDDVADGDVAGALVYRLEHGGDHIDVILIELVDPPKPKKRERLAVLERKVRDLFDIEARLDTEQRSTSGALHGLASRVTALTGRVEICERPADAFGVTDQRLTALEERLVARSPIDVGELVDHRLAQLDLPDRVGHLEHRHANHVHRTNGAEFDTNPATGLIRSRAGLTGKPEPTA